MENLSTNERKYRFLVIFDTCDVVYNWFISVLPPIVLDNLLGYFKPWILLDCLSEWQRLNFFKRFGKMNWLFASKSSLIIPISLQPENVNLWHFKRWLHDMQTEFIVWNQGPIHEFVPGGSLYFFWGGGLSETLLQKSWISFIQGAQPP